jgi:hypothetical protein
MLPVYKIYQHVPDVPLPLDWTSTAWQQAQAAAIDRFRPEGSNHRPNVQVRLLWSKRALHGIFRVHDRYVRCLRTRYFDEVWKDSCVEFFVQPVPGKGYFNFEFNCGGAFLCCYITDHTRVPGGFASAEKVPYELGEKVQVRSSLAALVDPEITEPINWFLQFSIPFEVLENYVGPLEVNPGDRWRGNFYKCGDEVSHPHWAAWAPVPELNFHLPESFGHLLFAAP